MMILRYYGDRIPDDAVLSAVAPYLLETGMHSQGMAIFFSLHGYDTLFAHHDLGVLDPAIENLTEDSLDKVQEALALTPDTPEHAYRRRKLKLDIEYIMTGGYYSTRLPVLGLVDEYLARGIPVALGVKNKGLHLEPSGADNNHSVLIVGRNDSSYIVNDPSPRFANSYSLAMDRLLHAWYSSGVYFLAACPSGYSTTTADLIVSQSTAQHRIGHFDAIQ